MPGKPDRERIIFAVEGLITYKWPKQDTDSAQPPSMPLEEPIQTQKGQKRRIRIQDLVRHALILHGAQAALGRAVSGNLARELSNAIMPDKGKGKGGKGMLQLTQSQSSQTGSVSALTQRLATRRRDRRQSVSEPPRSKRESETIASLIKANRVAQFVFSLNLGFSAMSQQPFGTVHTNEVFCNHPCAWCATHEEKPGGFCCTLDFSMVSHRLARAFLFSQSVTFLCTAVSSACV